MEEIERLRKKLLGEDSEYKGLRSEDIPADSQIYRTMHTMEGHDLMNSSERAGSEKRV